MIINIIDALINRRRCRNCHWFVPVADPRGGRGFGHCLRDYTGPHAAYENAKCPKHCWFWRWL